MASSVNLLHPDREAIGTPPMQSPAGGFGYCAGYTTTSYQAGQYYMPGVTPGYDGYSSYYGGPQENMYDRSVAQATPAGNYLNQPAATHGSIGFPPITGIKTEAPSSPDSGVDGPNESESESESESEGEGEGEGEGLSNSGSFGLGDFVGAFGVYEDQKPAPGKERVGKTRVLDKSSDEYRQKRDRNNVAVAKSRQKKKEQEQATEVRVKELETENGQLQEKVTALTQEINMLKKLYQDIYGQKQS